MDPEGVEGRDVSYPHRKEGCTQIEVTWSSSDDAHRVFAFYKPQDDNQLVRLCERARLEDYTGSDTVFDVATEWLRLCKIEHEHCGPYHTISEYPRRLLDVQSDLIYLVETRKAQISGPYATLSHSWGRDHFKVLTADTMEEFRRGMHLEDFLPTFRDAIIVAGKFEIRYLWIDCYCIIQSTTDKNDDQQHDIKRMSGIYSNAVLNIGADWAGSPSDGLFCRRQTKPPTLVKTFACPSYPIVRSYRLWHMAKVTEDYLDFIDPKKNSIFGRAWCMQERILCSRMLHFTRSGIFWECHEKDLQSDTFPFPHFPIKSENVSRLPPFSMVKRRNPRKPLASTVEWYKLVMSYSDMELSRPFEDKFNACSGVANRMSKQFNDSYVAGFFQKDLMWTLAGTRAGNKHRNHMGPIRNKNFKQEYPATRSRQWRAAAWSWASMNGPVELPNPSQQVSKDVTLIGLNCKAAGPSNPYGSLASATITIQAPAFKVILRSPRDVHAAALVYSKRSRIKVVFDSTAKQSSDLVAIITSWTPYDASGLVLTPVHKSSFEEPRLFVRVGAFQEEEMPDELHDASLRRFVEIV